MKIRLKKMEYAAVRQGWQKHVFGKWQRSHTWHYIIDDYHPDGKPFYTQDRFPTKEEARAAAEEEVRKAKA